MVWFVSKIVIDDGRWLGTIYNWPMDNIKVSLMRAITGVIFGFSTIKSVESLTWITFWPCIRSLEGVFFLVTWVWSWCTTSHVFWFQLLFHGWGKYGTGVWQYTGLKTWMIEMNIAWRIYFTFLVDCLFLQTCAGRWGRQIINSVDVCWSGWFFSGKYILTHFLKLNFSDGVKLFSLVWYIFIFHLLHVLLRY